MEGPEMVTKAIRALRSQLTERFEGRSEIIAVYLYGSHAEGHANALSDMDIGVLVRDGLAKERLWELEDFLAADLGRALRTDNLDLIVLNLAPLRIRYESSPGEKCCIRLAMERALISSPARSVATGISRSTLRSTIAAFSPESRRPWMKLNVASTRHVCKN